MRATPAVVCGLLFGTFLSVPARARVEGVATCRPSEVAPALVASYAEMKQGRYLSALALLRRDPSYNRCTGNACAVATLLLLQRKTPAVFGPEQLRAALAPPPPTPSSASPDLAQAQAGSPPVLSAAELADSVLTPEELWRQIYRYSEICEKGIPEDANTEQMQLEIIKYRAQSSHYKRIITFNKTGISLLVLGGALLIPSIALAATNGNLTGANNCPSKDGILGPCQYNFVPYFSVGFALSGAALGTGAGLLGASHYFKSRPGLADPKDSAQAVPHGAPLAAAP